MAVDINRQILLKSRPDGAPEVGNFELVQSPVPEPGEGEVQMRTRYLSLDPYMRGRMSDAKSYAKPVEVGEPMVGGTVGEIVKSRNAKFAVGEIVTGYGRTMRFPTAPACASSIPGGAGVDCARRASSRLHVRPASTSISRTWAVRSSKPCGRCSTISHAFRCAG